MRVLHVIDRLGAGGPSRAIAGEAAAARRLGLRQQHRLAVLEPGSAPAMAIAAHRAGIALRRVPDPAWLAESIAWAEIVVAQYWNTPSMTEFLESCRGAARMVMRCRVAGLHPPQMLAEDIAATADHLILGSPATAALAWLGAPAWRERVSVIAPSADPARLEGFVPRPHRGFVVAYVGTVGGTKLHPRFVAMSAAARIPEVRFVVCGGHDPGLVAEAARLGVADRFVFPGFVEDVRAVLEEADLLGYPLRPDAYASSDLSLQEAMWCGIPPVLLPHLGTGWMVEHGRSGVVAADEAGYSAALELLHARPDERARLGQGARLRARALFDPDRTARSLDEALRGVLAAPQRRAPPRPPDRQPFAAARRFVRALGPHGAAFAASLRQERGAAEAADAAIGVLPDEQRGGEGGLVHWRNRHREDGYLRYWTGLCLAGSGRLAEARRELEEAAALGAAPGRVEARLAALGKDDTATSGR
ncbi:MAG: glycosyltransferase family 4 protein [Dongiaceae bacterium]